jgi:hypothetical protein
LWLSAPGQALSRSDLHVKVQDGVATITGNVPTAEARNKVVTLAADTVGVNKVVDELTIPASEADRPSPRTPQGAFDFAASLWPAIAFRPDGSGQRRGSR